ncbi:MAG: hypothetical protein M3256_03675 [Actinomycetota bacterium]|nr:hypothetical protein [Actinomycetota bacterium]
MTPEAAAAEPVAIDVGALVEIQGRVLWLAANMVHVANKVRPNPSGIKVGGHHASSASMVTILTELFFDFMREGDRISVKPHASPRPPRHPLPTRQPRPVLPAAPARPARTAGVSEPHQGPGSGRLLNWIRGPGIGRPQLRGPCGPIRQARFGAKPGTPRRFISVLGDAELNEGSIWEAVAEPALAGLNNLIWIVDLNRQSLDRVVPGIRVRQLEDMFRANGWRVIEAKYGRKLEDAFAAPGGNRLREAIDDMPNERYQFLLRSGAETIAEALGDAVPDIDDAELKTLIQDLGGHDFQVLRRALQEADSAAGPAVVFA